MVKIPKFDDLKKMGSELFDSAKVGKLSGVMDKLKSGMDSISKKPPAGEKEQDESLNKVLTGLHEALNELTEVEKVQTQIIKKMQTQLTDLVNILQSYEKVSETKSTPSEAETPQEPPTDQKQD